MPVPVTTFQSERAHLENTRFVKHELADPSAGEILIGVDTFALTANNITYGVAGDSIGYWQFFPAAEGWGCIPVWGFGDVVASEHPAVAVGERLYGYFPMSTHVVLKPENVAEHGFADGASHRAQLPAIYNQYVRTAADPAYEADAESEQILYRPLFTTSYLLDDFLEDNGFFTASNVLLTSASSKTSIGLAYLLARRPQGQCRVLGLTSAVNRPFVESLGCYAAVYTYDDAASLPQEPTVLVDMAGSARVRASVHNTLGDLLRFSSAVGATHWADATVGIGQSDLPGPRPTMFFAPSQAQKRIGESGRAAFEAGLAEAWKGFLPAARGWIDVERGQGEADLERFYAAFIAGAADPAKGYIVSL